MNIVFIILYFINLADNNQKALEMIYKVVKAIVEEI